MRTVALLVLVACSAGCAASLPRVEEPARSRALRYQQRAELLEAAGDRQAALHFATRALVVRLAACGYECAEVAYSFVQLGDLRYRNAQPAWAAQSYARALELLGPHRATHRGWIEAATSSLVLACATAPRPPPGCRSAAGGDRPRAP